MVSSDLIRIGPRAQQGLRHAGVGAMAALLVSAVVPGSSGWARPDVGVLLALAVGALLAWRRNSMIVVVAAGAAVYLVVTTARLAI